MTNSVQRIVAKTILVAFLSVGFFVCSVAATMARHVVVVLSQTGGPYHDALAGLRRHLDQQDERLQLTILSADGEEAKVAALLEEVKKLTPDLVVTFGSIATRAAARAGLSTPLIATLVLHASDLQHTPNATAIQLDFPVDTQLRWLQQMLPQQTRIGVLFNPATNRDLIDTATQAAKRLGLTLVPRAVTTPQALPDALSSLTSQIDVLWGVPDPVVLSAQTSESILLFSFRNHIPFIGLSTPWVKAGALYALDRDYQDLGSQCGELALRILQGVSAETLPPTPPRKVIYALNLKTADYMKLAIPQHQLDGAQQIFQ